MIDEASPVGSIAEENETPRHSGQPDELQKPVAGTGAEEKQDEEQDIRPSKRLRTSRVSRACDQCRSKKDKCDGLQPTCSTCTLLSRSCTYRSSPRKRGVPTGYIRTLELLWGIVFSEIKGSENAAQVLLRTKDIPRHLAVVSRDGESRDTYLSAWKTSVVLKDIERILDQREGDTSPIDFDEVSKIPSGTGEQTRIDASQHCEWQVPNTQKWEGNSTIPLQSPNRLLKLDHPTMRSPASIDSASRGTRSETESRLIADVQSSNIEVASSLHSPGPYLPRRTFELPLHIPMIAWRLFDIYFSYTHCWFPIIEKHDILRTAFSYSQRDTNITASQSESGDHATMWAVLALAAIQDISAVPHGMIRDSKREEEPESNTYYDIAKTLIPSEDAKYEIGHVQALLILSLMKFGNQDLASAWLLIGHATRMALYLELDHPVSESSAGHKINNRRKHVFLGCFILETVVASQLGRLPQLRKEHIARINQLEEDGLDEWQPWEDLVDFIPDKTSRISICQGPSHIMSTFKRLLSIASILNDICCYKDEKETRVSSWRLVDVQLQRWRAELPESFCIQQDKTQSTLLAPHILGLHLAYRYTTALLYQSVSNNPNIGDAAEREFRIQLTNNCERIVDLLQRYIECYSISATSPIFEAYLSLASCLSCERQNKEQLHRDLTLNHKMQSLSSRLRHVWTKRESQNPRSKSDSIIARTKTSDLGEDMEHLKTFNNPHLSGGTAMDSGLLADSSIPHVSYTAQDIHEREYLTNNERSSIISPWNMLLGATVASNLETDTMSKHQIASVIPAQPIGGYLDPTIARKGPATAGFNPTIPSTASFGGNTDSVFNSPTSSTQLPPREPSDLRMPSHNQGNNDSYRDQPTSSSDLDALFDELASYEATEM